MSKVLGNFSQSELGDYKRLDQRLAREQLLSHGSGADLFQQALIFEIDPVGGLFGNTDDIIGSPRFSVRARILNQTGEGATTDILRDSDELPVFFPFYQAYHDHNPIKIGEKVWVIDLCGIDGVTQKYWLWRVNSPSPLSIEPFARPDNNYSNASFELNIGRNLEIDEPLSLNSDLNTSDTVEKVALRSPEVFGDIDFPGNARSNFSRVIEANYTKHGFVNEPIKEWFFRPSDRVIQGSNNSGVIFGTNMPSIEIEEEDMDIADIIDLFGSSNNAADFSNASDPDVIVAGKSPIASKAEEKTSMFGLIAGRKFNLFSYNFDASSVSGFEKRDIDNINDLFKSNIENIEGESSGNDPSILLRTDNFRGWFRKSAALGIDGGRGIYINENNINLISNDLINIKIENISLSMNREGNVISMNTGGAELTLSEDSVVMRNNINSIDISSSGIAISGPSLDLSNISQFVMPSTITTSGPLVFSAPITVGSGGSQVANRATMLALSNSISVAANTLNSVPTLAPVAASLTAIAQTISSLPYSSNLIG